MNIVYILQSKKDQSYYTGITENLRGRIHEHNTRSSKYSSTKAPFGVVWYACFKNKKKAYDFEKYLKTGSGIAFRNKHLI